MVGLSNSFNGFNIICSKFIIIEYKILMVFCQQKERINYWINFPSLFAPLGSSAACKLGVRVWTYLIWYDCESWGSKCWRAARTRRRWLNQNGKFRYLAMRIMEHEKHGVGDVETTIIIETAEAFSWFGNEVSKRIAGKGWVAWPWALWLKTETDIWSLNSSIVWVSRQFWRRCCCKHGFTPFQA